MCVSARLQVYAMICSFVGEFGETGSTDTNWLLGGGQSGGVRSTALAEYVTVQREMYNTIYTNSCTDIIIIYNVHDIFTCNCRTGYI